MKRTLFLTALRVGLAAVAVVLVGASTAYGQVTAFDVANATATYPTGINSAGQITGYYMDATGQQHGFLRERGGAITLFNVQGSTGTVPQAINQAGQITGYSYGPTFEVTPHNLDLVRGFVRQPDGTIDLFDSCDFIKSYASVNYTWPQSIDRGGETAGFCEQGPEIDYYKYAFMRQADGTTQKIPIPYPRFSKLEASEAVAISPNGKVTGWYSPGTSSCCGYHTSGFLVHPDGTATLFDAVIGSGAQTLPQSINREGEITGSSTCGVNCTNYSGTTYSGFLRQKHGTITTFTPAGSVVTRPQVINSSGHIVGFYADAGNFYHGFLREPNGTIKTFDVKHSTNTYPTCMDAEGTIAGWYSDASGKVHGFVRSH